MHAKYRADGLKSGRESNPDKTFQKVKCAASVPSCKRTPINDQITYKNVYCENVNTSWTNVNGLLRELEHRSHDCVVIK